MAGPDGRATAALALVVNAFVWGVSWWPFRHLHQHGLHPLWATAAIYVLSLAVLLALWPRAWRGAAGQPQLWLLLVAAGLTNVGFNWAVTVGDVVRVVLLFYLMPAWSVLLAWPLLGERPTPAALLRLGVALAGVVTILQTPGTPWPVPESLADLLALLGGFSFALTNILLRRLQAAPAVTRVATMFAGGALAAGGAALVGLAQGTVAAPAALPLPALGVGLLLSLGFLVGNAALQYGASRLPAQTTALVMLSEVLFASATSVAAGAAELAARTWTGGALILAAAAWSAWAAPGPARPARAQSAA
ncbi:MULTISPECIES: EamA family transporter [Ramlibacter]|uniref:EamA family transporter n=1 Tax=Ramlibacter pinisoli TaxID=2682844 RepID=A0A6N8INV2_9BURK|nr:MULTISPECIES: EamA family transporter [Ramlibacter]MBA2960660.1 EamA family transporter [Ramlibacter sp. CGMCC 1.13660]MVQ27990.1 EamA family transporter [Ramlibacter pinisoli]